MEIHDTFTNFERICGFSIKSDLGNQPTLFNSSQSTNFQFEIFGVEDSDIEEINSISSKNKLRDRINKIPEMKFTKILSETFSKNLLFVDTQMGKILAEMLKIYYGTGISDCNEIATLLDEKDFLKFGAENLYSHKLKKFLCAVALGLRPKKFLNGLDEANGGYIIVKESGEILAYHLHDRDSFENYLINNTKFDTPSTERHKFGKIYVEDGKKFINLNLQIRFK